MEWSTSSTCTLRGQLDTAMNEIKIFLLHLSNLNLPRSTTLYYALLRSALLLVSFHMPVLTTDHYVAFLIQYHYHRNHCGCCYG